ncbi:MAG: hypothetical protein K8R46_05010, partial [Pirellulales bacterium]|nr:hypothetical protein [Pirellulales bacterium]
KIEMFATEAVRLARVNKEKTNMPSELVIIGIVILLGAWLLLGERKSFLEKISMVFALLFIYVAYRLLNGASLDEILSSFVNALK